MDYSIIKAYLKSIKITQKELSKSLGFSEAGFIKTLKNDSLKVRDLEKIAKYLNIPITEFFTKSYSDEYFFLNKSGSQSIGNKGASNIMNESKGEYLTQKNKGGNTQNEIEMLQIKLKALQNELKLKDEIINLLKRE